MMSLLRILCFMFFIKCKVLCLEEASSKNFIRNLLWRAKDIKIVCADIARAPDYYWREYTGTIPDDAVIAGKNINSHYVYIGQAYVKNHGSIVVQINRNQKEVEAAMAGVQKLKENIKILCGFQSNFKWLRTSAANLHLDLIEKHPVIGGNNDGYGYLNVGRISLGGSIRIGKVNAFSIGDAGMWFPEKGSEKNLKAYEVLYFENNSIDPRQSLTVKYNNTIFDNIQ